MWLGPNPSVIILESEIIREIFLKNFVFQKPRTHPVAKFLVQGLVVSEGDEWTKRRKIINPAFHLEKLKVV